jgi:formate dehydrogenase subunit gamma
VVLGITGIFIWATTQFPRIIVQLSLMLHGLMFVCSIMFAIVHVYLATLGNPGTLESMLWGSVTRNWAKHHHARWYKENFEK